MNIVTIGGGDGHAQVLRGLRTMQGITITGICPSTDSGGSTGKLIREYGCLGYIGDLTKCIAALCPNETLAVALTERFNDGHSFKNLLLVELSRTGGSLQEAILSMERICRIAPHHIVPVSMERTELCARLKFGRKIYGETQIDNLAKNPLWSPDVHAIKSVYLRPSVRASGDAIAAIQNAARCIICPGDLYSSIVPVLLPKGMKQAFRRTKAQIILILNIMTKCGETDGYRAEDFVREIESRIDRSCDVILVNSVPIPKRSLLRYRMERKIQLSSRVLKRDSRFIHAPLMAITDKGYLYHDPDALRIACEKIFAGTR